MTTTSQFMTLPKSCNEAVTWAINVLEHHGLQSIRTFDLHAARVVHADCPCPHHGTEHCNCQMVVLLVYQGSQPPATLVLHGSDKTSWLYLVNTPQQPVDPSLEKTIIDVLNDPI